MMVHVLFLESRLHYIEASQLVHSTLYTKQGLLHTPSTVHLAAYPEPAMAQVVMDVVLRLIEIPQNNF